MGAAEKLNEEITAYLELLNERQKEAVLAVVKTFAQDSEGSPEYDEQLRNELDSRYQEWVSGGQLLSEAEVTKSVRNIIGTQS